MSKSFNAAGGISLRAMTWNIHKGVGGMDRRYDLDRVADVIQHYAPDVALLQEVAQGIPRLRLENQVEQLAGALGYQVAYHPEHQFRRGGYGNLILSRWPFDEVHHMDLTIGWRKRRGALLARTVVQVGRRRRHVVLANLHLGLAGRERAQQLHRLVSSAAFRILHPTTPMILGGDLNDVWSSLGAAYLLPNGFARAGKAFMTFPAAMPIRPLDGLYFRGDLTALGCDVGRTSLARVASDHLPLVADLALSHHASDETCHHGYDEARLDANAANP